MSENYIKHLNCCHPNQEPAKALGQIYPQLFPSQLARHRWHCLQAMARDIQPPSWILLPCLRNNTQLHRYIWCLGFMCLDSQKPVKSILRTGMTTNGKVALAEAVVPIELSQCSMSNESSFLEISSLFKVKGFHLKSFRFSSWLN